MAFVNFVRPEPVSLKLHPNLNEKWVQERIASDPSMLGLGDLVLRQSERAQPRAGRLDLLLQDPETQRRYEVEVQLGPTDEAHIIRTIEYWDIERRRYPQYDHCAVIVAEDITSRFLNVIGLFNGAIPLIAIQMRAVKVGEAMTLVFTKVVDELVRGPIDEDEEADAAPADRAYWEKKGSKRTVELGEQLLALARQFEPTVELKYNKLYIGLARDGQAFNFIRLRPKKQTINIDIKLPRDAAVDRIIEDAGLTTLEYSTRWSWYRLSLSAADVASKQEALKEVIGMAHRNRVQ